MSKNEVHYRSALVERHWVTTKVPVKNSSDVRRKKAVAECREFAAPRMAAAGLLPSIAEEWHRPGESGVSWTVVVGECHTTGTERHPFWVYTTRWRHWFATLSAVALRDRSTRMNEVVELAAVRR